MEIICFFIGTAFFCAQKSYPMYLFFIVLCFKPTVRCVVWFIMALIWGACHHLWVADYSMPNRDVIQNASIEGIVASIPMKTEHKTEFQFRIRRLSHQPVNALVQLACYQHCPDFRAGDHWRLTVKLKKPHNLSNPGGFDYVHLLQSRHVHWTGYLRTGSHVLIQSSNWRYALLRFRQNLADELEKMDPDSKTLGIFQALTLGITTHLNKDSWDLFRRTGTTHLMVISGAHIGLVVGLTYGLIKWLWCRFHWMCLRIPATKIASLCALLMGVIYALLAGFGVPAQRALIVCFFMFLHHFFSQRIGVWQAWRYALFAVLVFEPHSVMLSGFYLSFIAVAILIVINQRFSFMGFRKTLFMQVGCLLGLMPLTLYFFSYGAMNGFFANLLAIPWVSFIIVPLGLFITLLGHWFSLSWLIALLTHAINYLLIYLHWVDSFSIVNLAVSFDTLMTPIALMVAMSVLVCLPLPRLIPVLSILVVGSLFPATTPLKTGDVRIDVLDVGQGLAVVVRTAHHVLVYDTGVKFYQGGDMGQLALIPYLNASHVTQLDKVVISHPDLDHRGGLASLEKHYPIYDFIVNDPDFYKRGSSCHEHPDWVWDGVLFHFFPIQSIGIGKNNSSCVLQISNASGKLLLTGDIEKPAEEYLIRTYGHQLASTVLLVPHHGSKTSSSLSFINHVAPQYAIMSYGFDNRFHFPHQKVMQTYQSRDIPVYNTVDCGMISVYFSAHNNRSSPTCYKKKSWIVNNA